MLGTSKLVDLEAKNMACVTHNLVQNLMSLVLASKGKVLASKESGLKVPTVK